MTDNAANIDTLLGTGARFNGKLAFQGTVRIEGAFEGEVLSEDTLVVAQGGDIRGTIRVGRLVVAGGHVEAEVIATQAVELLSGGVLTGRVTTPSLLIEKGAVFRGESIMTGEADTDTDDRN